MKWKLLFVLQICLAMCINVLSLAVCGIAVDVREKNLPVDAIYYNYDNYETEHIRLFCETEPSCKVKSPLRAVGKRLEDVDKRQILVRIVKDGVYLQSRKNYGREFRLFELPVSWFLLAEDTGGRYYKLTVPDSGASGYVLKQDVRVCDEMPSMPYYPVVYAVVTAENTVVYEKPDISSMTHLIVRKGEDVRVIGSKDTADESWYYVEKDGVIGYVRLSKVTGVEMGLHKQPIASSKQIQIQEEEKTMPKEQWAMTVFVIMILLIVLTAVSVPYMGRLLSRKGNPAVKGNARMGL